MLFLHCPAFEVLLEGTRGGGKGLPLEEPVLTPRGERAIGSLAVGSPVCAPDGTVSRVIGVYPQGKRPTYEIAFDDGAIARCDDQHIWPIHIQGEKSKRGLPYRLMAMPEVLRHWRAGHRVHIPTMDRPAAIISHPQLKAWPVEPYLLGLLLGDGSFNLAGDIRFCTADSELAETVISSGFTEYCKDRRNGRRSFGIGRRSQVGLGIKRLGLLRKRAWEKAIPRMYRVAPADVRLAILQGLMDTDGHIDRRGNTSFSSCSEQLAKDVQWLVWSLGGKATLWRKTTAARDAFCLYIQTGGKFNPFRLARKAARSKPYQHNRLWRRIVSIRELGEQETVCIKVDHPSGLFLTRDFVVTHNTDALLMDFAHYVGRGYGPSWCGILFRQSYPNLEEVLAKSLKFFTRIFPGARFNYGKYCWQFPGGEILYLRHANRPSDYWNYHGFERPWVGWEELTNWADDELYLSLMSICRSSDPRVPRHYRATCNPYGPGHHWVKRRFIDPAPRNVPILDSQGRIRVAIHSSIYECPQLMENDPAYIKTLQALDGPKRQAWLFGDWNIVAGGMFGDLWDEDIHVVAPFPIPPSWYIDRSFDWGSSKPYSVGWWAESDGTEIVYADGSTKPTTRGDLYRIGELYGSTGKPNEGTRELAVEVARRIVDRETAMGYKVRPGPADGSIFTVENGRSIADDMASIGVRWLSANQASGSRQIGWERMRMGLKNSITHDGPGLYVFDTCRDFIRTVPALPRDQRDMDDIDTTAEDHIADEARYRFLSKKFITRIQQI